MSNRDIALWVVAVALLVALIILTVSGGPTEAEPGVTKVGTKADAHLVVVDGVRCVVVTDARTSSVSCDWADR